METTQILKETPFFGSLDPDELEAVGRCVVSRRVARGAAVIREGETGESLYIVRSGKLRVEKSAGGKSLLLAELKPGDAFGEMSLIDSVPTSASVIAAEDAELLGISRLDLNVLLNWNPILASKMWRSFTYMLSLRLRETNEQLAARR